MCYLLGRLIYAAFVSQQYLGLCPFWLLCINSSPSYGYCLLSKNNIHPQSKRMGRSSVFIINVANHGKNVSDSAGVNESAASSPEVGSGSSRGTARRLDWTCLFYRLHIVWSMLSNLPLCQTELTYELTWNLFLLCGVMYRWSECPNEEGESHRAGALLQIADLRSCINARAKSGNRHKKRKCGNDHLSGGRKGAAAMTERFLYVNRVLLLVVSMRRVRKSRTRISLMKYFGLQADKTFLMTLVKFRNKNKNKNKNPRRHQESRAWKDLVVSFVWLCELCVDMGWLWLDSGSMREHGIGSVVHTLDSWDTAEQTQWNRSLLVWKTSFPVYIPHLCFIAGIVDGSLECSWEGLFLIPVVSRNISFESSFFSSFIQGNRPEYTALFICDGGLCCGA